MDIIDRDKLLKDIEDLKNSYWYNLGKNMSTLGSLAKYRCFPEVHLGYIERKEAVEILETIIKEEPTEEKTATLILNEALGDFYNCSNCGTLMRSKTESESITYSAIKPRVNYCFNCGRRFV